MTSVQLRLRDVDVIMSSAHLYANMFVLLFMSRDRIPLPVAEILLPAP